MDPISISLRLSRARDALNGALQRHLARAGLAGTVKVGMGPVLFLLDRRGDVHPSEIARELGLARSTVTSLKAQLVQRELVEVHPDPADGRASTLTLTARGREVVRTLRAIEAEVDRAILSVLEEGDEAWLRSRLELIGRALRES